MADTLTAEQQAAADAAAAKASADAKAASDAAAKAAADQKKTDDEKSLDKFPPELREHIRDIREESRKRLDKIRELEASATTSADKLAAYEKAEQERERAKLAEEKKFQEIADKEKARADKIEADSKEALRKKDVALIRSVLRSIANDLGIVDPDDIKDIDVREMRVTDEGDVPGAKESVEALKTRKPHWFKDAAGAANNGNGGRARTTTPSGSGGGGSGEDASKWTSAELKQRWNAPPPKL